MSPPAVAPWQRLGVDVAGARSSWRARIVNTEVCFGPGGPLGDLTSVWRPLAAAYVTDLLLGPFFRLGPFSSARHIAGRTVVKVDNFTAFVLITMPVDTEVFWDSRRDRS